MSQSIVKRQSVVGLNKRQSYIKRSSVGLEPFYYGKLIVKDRNDKILNTHNISSDVMIGRDAVCEIRIVNNSISRKHAKISLDENGSCQIEVHLYFYFYIIIEFLCCCLVL